MNKYLITNAAFTQEFGPELAVLKINQDILLKLNDLWIEASAFLANSKDVYCVSYNFSEFVFTDWSLESYLSEHGEDDVLDEALNGPDGFYVIPFNADDIFSEHEVKTEVAQNYIVTFYKSNLRISYDLVEFSATSETSDNLWFEMHILKLMKFLED